MDACQDTPIISALPLLLSQELSHKSSDLGNWLLKVNDLNNDSTQGNLLLLCV